MCRPGSTAACHGCLRRRLVPKPSSQLPFDGKIPLLRVRPDPARERRFNVAFRPFWTVGVVIGGCWKFCGNPPSQLNAGVMPAFGEKKQA